MSENHTALEGNEATHHSLHRSGAHSEHTSSHAHSLKETAHSHHNVQKAITSSNVDRTQKKQSLLDEIRESESQLDLSSASSQAEEQLEASTLFSAKPVPPPMVQETLQEVANSMEVSAINANSLMASANDMSGFSSIMEDEKSPKLKHFHKRNRVIVFSELSVQAILDAIKFKHDTIFGSSVLENLKCKILFFKSRTLMTSALTAANKLPQPLYMFAQTIRTEFKYEVGKDLSVKNLQDVIAKLGASLVSLNVSTGKDKEFWAVGTGSAINKKLLSSFKLTSIRTDLTVFRIAFPRKETQLGKLKSAVSNQWKVGVVDVKLVNKVAYVSVKRSDVTNNITKSIQIGNQNFRNLSYSDRVAKSIAARLDNVEKHMNDMSATLQKMVKDATIYSGKKMSSDIAKLTLAVNTLTERISNALSLSTARHSQGSGKKSQKGRRNSK